MLSGFKNQVISQELRTTTQASKSRYFKNLFLFAVKSPSRIINHLDNRTWISFVFWSLEFSFPHFFPFLQISIKVQFPSLVLRDYSYFLYFPLKFWKEIGAQAAKLIMIYSHMPYVWPLNWQIHSAYTDGPLVKDRVSTSAEHDLMYQQGVYKIESRCCLMVSLTVIAVKLNSTASIILFRKDYLSQQWSFSSQGNPSSSISLFYKVWQKFYWNFWEGWPYLAKGCMERWNGGISENTEWRKTLTYRGFNCCS